MNMVKHSTRTYSDRHQGAADAEDSERPSESKKQRDHRHFNDQNYNIIIEDPPVVVMMTETSSPSPPEAVCMAMPMQGSTSLAAPRSSYCCNPEMISPYESTMSYPVTMLCTSYAPPSRTHHHQRQRRGMVPMEEATASTNSLQTPPPTFMSRRVTGHGELTSPPEMNRVTSNGTTDLDQPSVIFPDAASSSSANADVEGREHHQEVNGCPRQSLERLRREPSKGHHHHPSEEYNHRPEMEHPKIVVGGARYRTDHHVHFHYPHPMSRSHHLHCNYHTMGYYQGPPPIARPILPAPFQTSEIVVGDPSLQIFKLRLPVEHLVLLDRLVMECEQYAATLKNGWMTHLYSLTKQDLALQDVPGMLELAKPITKFMTRAICHLYGAKSIKVDRNQPHVLKYCKSHTGVELHHDRCDVTANLCMSRSHTYVGGGTMIPDINKVVRLKFGEFLLHPGSLVHGGMDITHGTRYLFVLFAHLRK